MKIAFEMHARQPDVELVEDLAVGHPDRAKQFRLGNFKEANIRAVENYVRRVDITPTHAFFDGELLGHCVRSPSVSEGNASIHTLSNQTNGASPWPLTT